MTDDANFCNGRLRLTAFLRVVEDGMPPRPSRFKRRVPFGGSSPQDSAFSEPVHTEACPEYLKHSTVTQASGLNMEVTPGVPSAPDVQFDMPRSPTPTQLYVCPGSSKQLRLGSSDEESASERQTVAHAIPQATTDQQAVHASKVRIESSRPQKSTDTRKRRLPVTGLALVRTTTSDGLPDPSDACNAFAVSVTDFDPIDDSQLNLSVFETHSTNKSSRRPIRSTKSIIGHGIGPRSSFSIKLSQLPIPRRENCPVIWKRKPDARVSSCFVADGFVGSELTVEPARKPLRRAKIVPRQSKPDAGKVGLALVDGLLPLPNFQYTKMTIDPEHETEEALHSFDVNSVEVKAMPGQLDLVRTSAEKDFKQPRFQQVQQAKHTVKSQLSSITAPIRRESESSNSDVFNEGESTMDGEEEAHDAEEMDETAYSQSASLLRQRSTIVVDYGYFENAMHDLEIAQRTRRIDDEFWS